MRTENYEGIICIDKPPGHTSFDVVARLRGILRMRKIGHAGTLDPMATGVLPVFLGRATKACDLLPDQTKRYSATMRLGVTTDTQDITGTVLTERPPVTDEAAIVNAVSKFVGEQPQLPPMYSAVQVGGVRLYDLARQGREVEREPRVITVHELNITKIDGPDVQLDILCSRGTYIRTLAHDIGELLGCGATLTALRRTQSSGFTERQCLTLAEVTQRVADGSFAEAILPVAAAFEGLPRIALDDKTERLYLNGVRLTASRLGFEGRGGDVAVYNTAGELLGISQHDPAGDLLLLRTLFKLG